MGKERAKLLFAVVDRAYAINPYLPMDKLVVLMDLQHTDELFDLRLEEMLSADRLDFMHDIYGILEHFDRDTKEMMHCFVPRFAGKQ